jgi:hypothetical protein
LDTHKERAEAQLRQQMQWAEERLRSELKKKEEHAISELEKMELLTQARTTAAVTLEKAKRLEDTKDLQIQVQLHAFEHQKRRVDMLEELLRQNCYFLQFLLLIDC